jgi:hypothetical protein
MLGLTRRDGFERRRPRRGTERSDMGTIIQFPNGYRHSRDLRPGGQSEDATIIILPSIRVERHPEFSADGADPHTKDSSPRSRRRRGSR